MGWPPPWRYDALRVVRRAHDGCGDAAPLDGMPEAAEGGEMTGLMKPVTGGKCLFLMAFAFVLGCLVGKFA